MKSARHFAIREIVISERIATQEELCHALASRGLEVTQATISRDIKELQLIKIPDDYGYHYALPDNAKVSGLQERMKRLFRDSVVDIEQSENLIVIKTIPGAAQAVASMVDVVRWEKILGTVAGDDTIFIAVKPKEAAPQLVEEFLQLIRS
ncbi:MAG TPA: arginine repressor [Syntrophomonadaceae bacterium]|nr:arginine repressor [Syntrophomonadaceae bacterium]